MLNIARSPGEADEFVRALPRPLALVPTMGAIHAGHLALIDAAKGDSASVAVSIFVNPLQFGPAEDYARYPRSFENDCALLAERRIDLIYAPSTEAMYPARFAAAIDAGPVAERFEGALRPGHFRGVATVVAKLVNTIQPDLLVMGRKDAQQNAVLARMLQDLNMRTVLVVVDTVREPDGLALSSRNVYLNAEQRAVAPRLYQALRAVAASIEAGETNREYVLAGARPLLGAPLKEAYLDVVDPTGFEPLDPIRLPCTVIGSVWAGTTRIIDNIALS